MQAAESVGVVGAGLIGSCPIDGMSDRCEAGCCCCGCVKVVPGNIVIGVPPAIAAPRCGITGAACVIAPAVGWARGNLFKKALIWSEIAEALCFLLNDATLALPIDGMSDRCEAGCCCCCGCVKVVPGNIVIGVPPAIAAPCCGITGAACVIAPAV